MAVKKHLYSRYTKEAMALLGKLIKLGRKQKKWTENELAERANIARGTLQKMEKGDLKCEIGLVFEVAALVGVKLFDSEYTTLTIEIDKTSDKIALLPKSVRTASKEIDDDF